MTLTGNKDTDYIIISGLNDRSLFSYCQADRTNRICNDEDFWRNRFYERFGEKAENYQPSPGTTWKNHYLQVVTDLEKFTQNPSSFINLIQFDSSSLFIVEEDKNSWFSNTKKVYFNDWPKWVKTNFYLLDIGNIYYMYNPEMDPLKHVSPSKYFQLGRKDYSPYTFYRKGNIEYGYPNFDNTFNESTIEIRVEEKGQSPYFIKIPK